MSTHPEQAQVDSAIEYWIKQINFKREIHAAKGHEADFTYYLRDLAYYLRHEVFERAALTPQAPAEQPEAATLSETDTVGAAEPVAAPVQPVAWEWLTPVPNGTWRGNLGYEPPRYAHGYARLRPLYATLTPKDAT